jgi:PKD repeat protein
MIAVLTAWRGGIAGGRLWEMLGGLPAVIRSRRVVTSGLGVVALAAVVAVGLGVDDVGVVRLETGDHGVWLPFEAAGELVLVDTATGVAMSRTLVTPPDTEVEVIADDGVVGVVSRAAGDLVVVDPAFGAISDRVALPVSDVTEVVTSDDAWVIGSEGVARVPLRGGEPELVELAGPVTSAAPSGDGVALVIDGMRVDVASGGKTVVGDAMESLAVASVGEAVATITPTDRVVRLDDGTSACVLGDVEKVTSWAGSVTGRRFVVGANDETGVVHVSELDNGGCRLYEITDEAASFSRPLVVEGVLYVADTATGQLDIIDLETNLRRSIELFEVGESVRLLYQSGEVIAHEPASSRGAVIGPEGVRQLIDKSGGRPLISPVADSGLLAVGEYVTDEAAGVAVFGSGGDSSSFAGRGSVALVEGSEVDQPSDELVADFAFSSAVVSVGETVVFVDRSRGDPDDWTWDFGDGNSGSGPTVEYSWSQPGVYLVTLSVARADVTSSVSTLVEVVPEDTVIAPNAGFSVSALTVEVGEPVTFVDTSVGDVDQRRWDLGDGTSATDAEVRKTWSSAGRYLVTLEVANDAGSDQASVTITVARRLEPPVAGIAVADTRVEVGEGVRLTSASTGEISSSRWDFGDGVTATGSEVLHSYAQPGVYRVTLTVANEAGASSATVLLTVEPPQIPPEARISGLPDTVDVGVEITFASTSINEPDTLDWDLGDGTTGSGETISHAWATPGEYLVTLTAANEAGTSSTTATLTVLPLLPPPVASFVAPSSVRAGTSIDFVDTSSNVETWFWEFGDGTTSAESAPAHSYVTPGTVVVTLTVTNRNGSDTAEATVEVLPQLPVAGFSSSLESASVGESVVFTDASVGATTHHWDFGDGATSTEVSPTHAYTQPGAYTVVLTVANSIGETDTFSLKVRVNNSNSDA